MNLIMKVRQSAKLFIGKFVLFAYELKTHFHNKSFALSLAFIMRFKVTQKWPIGEMVLTVLIVLPTLA